MNRPLEGIRIADFTQLAQGPFAAQILADLGADVVKIEPPKGDWMRHYAIQNSTPGGVSVSFLVFNRNKRSIAVDLRTEKGKEVVHKIVDSCDALVENFRPGVMERLEMGYEQVSATNPGLVYCSSTGFGSDGPYRERPGQDLLAQVMSGIPSTSGRADDPPIPVGIGVADLTAGLHIAYSVLGALVGRERTGVGRKVEVNLLSSVITLMVQEYAAYFAEGWVPERSSVVPGSPYTGAPYGLYETKDGHIGVAMNDIGTLCALLGVEEFRDVEDSNLPGEEGDRIRVAIAEALATETTSHWLDVLLGEDLWVAPLQSFADVAVDPQVAFNELIVDVPHSSGGTFRTIGNPVRMPGTERVEPTAPPTVGQHTREILAEVGFEEQEIDTLYEEGVVL